MVFGNTALRPKHGASGGIATGEPRKQLSANWYAALQSFVQRRIWRPLSSLREQGSTLLRPSGPKVLWAEGPLWRSQRGALTSPKAKQLVHYVDPKTLDFAGLSPKQRGARLRRRQNQRAQALGAQFSVYIFVSIFQIYRQQIFFKIYSMPQRLQSYFFDYILPSWSDSVVQQTDFSKTDNSFLQPKYAEKYTDLRLSEKPPTDVYYSHPSQIPRLQKIVLNRGLGDASKNTKILESSLREFQMISGQKALIQYSKKSIAGFHLRKKMPVGVSVTLRRNFMYGFLDRLINLALPRIRDFPGLSLKSFDGCGNYNFGLDEQLMFPEVHYDQIQQIRGMDIAIVTTAQTDREGFALLQAFGMPFQKSLIQDTIRSFEGSPRNM